MLNRILINACLAVAFVTGLLSLEEWTREREARVVCAARDGHSSHLVRVDGRTKIRCDRRQPDVSLAKAGKKK